MTFIATLKIEVPDHGLPFSNVPELIAQLAKRIESAGSCGSHCIGTEQSSYTAFIDLGAITEG